jgi:hypothetical protein
MHVDEPCTVYADLRDACVGMGIMVLGVCGVKPEGEGVLGTLAGVSSKQPTRIGDGGALLSVSPLLRFLEHRCWGFNCVWRT